MNDEIYVLDKKVKLLQPNGGFRTALDSVMLAAAVPVKAGESVLDMGCGVGGASFCLLWREPQTRFTGIDWHQNYVDLAIENAALNNRDAVFQVGDIRTYAPEALFDHVMMNPPYFEAGKHMPSPDPARAQANGHQDEDLTLDDWVKAAHRLVKSNGSFTIIYPASGVDKIIKAMGKRFGAIEIIPLWQRAGAEARRVIIRAVKDRLTPTRILPGLTLHEENGEYTKTAEAVLRNGDKI